jgi:hypothetical protein
MNLSNLANIGKIAGALVMVISLFYVTHQIRRSPLMQKVLESTMRIDNFFDGTDVQR